MMKNWRVGSLSMGLVLVASGVMMLASLVVRVNVLDVLLTFWPVILICLGAEILLHLFLKKGDEESKLRYDVLSVLFIGSLLVVSIGFYAVAFYAGMFETRQDFHAAFGIMSESAYVEGGETLPGTKELVVFDGLDSITVLSAADGDLKVEYSVSAPAYDSAYAQAALGAAVRLEHGERAYLLPNADMLRNDRKIGWPTINCVIHLPPDAALDLGRFWGSLEYDSAIEGQIIRRNDA